ncbi:sensor histidine kinase [Frigoribacterium faeni]|uniref:sensor histidine kinase n=1 Tax=Frigoribacterium faeni TaxID=145483 RepID=UPI001FBB3E76|nr:histidine kinase [Frigoribacterium faeni]NIJ04980.1 signal transduction histidine kinase [Frigoribacterium faeni]
MSTADTTDRPRGWARAWGEVWRLIVAALGGLVVSLAVWFGDPTSSRGADHLFVLFVLLDVVLGLTVLVLLPLRHRAPLVLTLVAAALAGFTPFGSVAASMMLVSLATRRRRAEIVPAALVFLVSSLLGELFVLSSEPSLPFWQTLLAAVLATTLIVVVGLYIGGRRELVRSLRERARLVEEEEQLRLGQARDLERTRIAREMHDVLAHRLSLVALHAGALEYREGLDPAEARATAGVIRDNARTALVELRDVLGVLREPDGSGAVAPPQPTLAGLGALLDEARAAGAVVQLESTLPVGDDPEEAPPTTISRHAYRIVQEGLTNARRHAPDQPVTITLGGRPGGDLVVRVENPVPASAPSFPDGAVPASSGGHGLDGLAERARLVGGHLTVDATHGRHVVEARLPWSR